MKKLLLVLVALAFVVSAVPVVMAAGPVTINLDQDVACVDGYTNLPNGNVYHFGGKVKAQTRLASDGVLHWKIVASKMIVTDTATGWEFDITGATDKTTNVVDPVYTLFEGVAHQVLDGQHNSVVLILFEISNGNVINTTLGGLGCINF